MTGAKAWQLCRAGKLDPGHFGVGGDGEWVGGWNFVLNELVLDLMALNKLELLPWDGNALSETDFDRLNDAELALLDRVAQLIEAGDNAFPEIRSLYESNSALRMPDGWKP
jgi:hypothetical protein